jgi:hypothetical protein
MLDVAGPARSGRLTTQWRKPREVMAARSVATHRGASASAWRSPGFGVGWRIQAQPEASASRRNSTDLQRDSGLLTLRSVQVLRRIHKSTAPVSAVGNTADHNHPALGSGRNQTPPDDV